MTSRSTERQNKKKFVISLKQWNSLEGTIVVNHVVCAFSFYVHSFLFLFVKIWSISAIKCLFFNVQLNTLETVEFSINSKYSYFKFVVFSFFLMYANAFWCGNIAFFSKISIFLHSRMNNMVPTIIYEVK